jgi:hypothetical protein
MGYEAEARTIQDLYLAGDKGSAIAAVPSELVEDPRHLKQITELIRA